MNRFKIIAKIGEGAYSTVYTVRRIEDSELYALKKVKLKNLSDKEKQNALNEVRILASVKSPYVISYKESFIDEVDSTLCIVMEYADEGDLFQKITLYKKLKTNFDEADIWRIFIQITKGLNDLHSYNILHRDMKSANVFLFRDGTAKLGDLNVSKITSRGLGCTQTGTPYYASPEVWKDNPYNLKSDIWSLGCVAYEMCMLKTPFRAETMEGLFNKILMGKYQRINKKYSDELNNVISRLLIIKPRLRPNTKEILSMNEVKVKIEEYDIFKNLKIKGDLRNKRLTAFTSNSNIDGDISNNNISNSDINQSIIGNKSIISRSNNIINSIIEEEEEENSRIVLDTIRMPNQLNMLNKRLPESNYESEKIFEDQKNLNNMSFPNKMLPVLKCRYNEQENSHENLKEDENNNIKRNIRKIPRYKIFKSVEIGKTPIDNNNIYKTLRMNIYNRDKNIFNPINGNIDIIIEENYNDNHDKNLNKKLNTRSLTKMKNLRCIYQPYVPKVLQEERAMKYNLSEESIFGNLNYSMNPEVIDNINNKELFNYGAKFRPKNLIPITRVKRK